MDHPLKLTNNSHIIGAIPALLGFVPTLSFIVILLEEDSTIRCVLRGDLDINPASAEKLTTISAPAFHDVDTVVLVAICPPELDNQAREVLDALRTSMRDVGIGVMARIQARDTTKVGQWLDIDTGHTGPVYPYTDAILTAQQVHRGVTVATARDQIVAEFAATPNRVPVIAGDPDDLAMGTLEELADATTGNTLGTPSLPTRAGILITQNIRLRDAALLLGMENPGNTAALWTHIAKHLVDEPRIQALTIAAAHYYMAGDAIRTGIALDVADEDATAAAVEYPSLASLLGTALQAGLPPKDVRAAMLQILSGD